MDEIQKYPVFAKSGTEYLVAKKSNNYFGGNYDVYLFVPYIGGFFRKKTKWKEISQSIYDGESFEYDFVKMAKDKVEKHEDYLLKAKEHKKSLIERQKEFENWDGKIH